jgi:hypothetical protein
MHYFYYLKLKTIKIYHFDTLQIVFSFFFKFTRHVSAPASRHLQGYL